MSDRLSNIGNKASSSASTQEVEGLLRSELSDERLQGLLSTRHRVEEQGELSENNFRAGLNLLDDSDNDCKWQAFIIVSRYISIQPEKCWEIIVDFGSRNDEDTQAAVATLLLEHYFEQLPQLFPIKFQELRQLIDMENSNLMATLKSCWSNWGNEENKATVEKYLEQKKNSEG